MLAETVSLDAGALLVGLLVGLVVLGLFAGTITLGFILAPKAALGPGRARTGWIAVVGVEGLFSILCVLAMIQSFTVVGLVVPGMLAAQVWTFLAARARD